jgi:hypothetical protein
MKQFVSVMVMCLVLLTSGVVFADEDRTFNPGIIDQYTSLQEKNDREPSIEKLVTDNPSLLVDDPRIEDPKYSDRDSIANHMRHDQRVKEIVSTRTPSTTSGPVEPQSPK